MQMKTVQHSNKENTGKTNSRSKRSSTTNIQKADGTAGVLLNLQQTHGNRYVQRLLSDAVIQRKCACGGTCDHCQSEGAHQDMIQHILQRKGGGQSLEPGVRGFMDSRFGEDFAGVRGLLYCHSRESKNTQGE